MSGDNGGGGTLEMGRQRRRSWKKVKDSRRSLCLSDKDISQHELFDRNIMVKDGRRTRLKPQPPREKEGQSGERFCVARTIQSVPNSWLPIFQGRSVEAMRDNEPRERTLRGHSIGCHGHKPACDLMFPGCGHLPRVCEQV